MDIVNGTRITMKLKHPNPLFEQWLTEWRDKAIETDSKMQYCFGQALQSLRKYPLPLDSGRDCRILQGFGEKLCQMIDKKLAEHKKDNTTIVKGDFNNQNKTSSSVKMNAVVQNLDMNRTLKEYVPVVRSGSYAILIALYEKSLQLQYPGYLHKTDIIKHGRHLCDKSFVKPDPGSYYTAWSSMKTLLEKKLVIKKSSPAQFSLSNNGILLAQKLYKNNLNENTNNGNNLENGNNRDKTDFGVMTKRFELSNMGNGCCGHSGNTLPLLPSVEIISKEITNQTEPPSISSLGTSQEETFIFIPHSFEIVLLVDKQETAGGSRNSLDDPILAELTELNVMHETRHLKVGDYTWVCRQDATNIELVLPYIIERKRMDDFGSSIKDGRFHEQKFRIKQCGLQNVVYLIESYGSNTHTGLPMTTLYQAATNTLLQDNFSVKFTKDLRATAEYLASFSLILKDIYKNKTLMSCPKQNLTKSETKDDLVPLMVFHEFNKGASKSRSFKVRELFVRQLLQLKGMSVDKVLAIVEKYPTPKLLLIAYNSNPNNIGEKLLSGMQYGKLGKKIGPAISKTIYQMYSSQRF